MTTVGGIDMIATYVGCSCIYRIYNGEDSVVGASFDGWREEGRDGHSVGCPHDELYIYIYSFYLSIYLYTGIHIYID